MHMAGSDHHMSEWERKEIAEVREAAAEWVVRLSSGSITSAEESQFFDWLRRSPLHVTEYLRAEATWLALDDVTQRDKTDVSTLLRERAANVVDLAACKRRPPNAGSGSCEAPKPPGLTSRLRVVVAATVATFLLLGAILAPWITGLFVTQTYSTGIGELRRVVLADGSVVELNTRTEVRVRLGDTFRDVYLENGEAYFEVAPDPERPFRVISDAATVQALGTQFSAYRQSEQTVVTVVEGRVAVSEARPGGTRSTPARSPKSMRKHQDAARPDVVELAAGYRVVVPVSGGGDGLRPIPIDARAATAWRQRRLVFENATLAEVVGEFNRYNRRQLLVEDPELASRRISGVFYADRPQALVHFLAKQSGVVVQELDGSRLVLKSPDFQ